MSFKKLWSLFVGLSVADVVSTAKNRFAQWLGELFSISCKGVHMSLKKLFAPLVGLTLAGAWSAAKIRFAPWRVNLFIAPQM